MLKLPSILEDLIDVTPPVGGAAVTSDYIQNFVMQQQEASQWCWAACASSTSKFFQGASTWNQCTIVNQQRGRVDCCTRKRSGECNKPDGLHLGLSITNNHNGAKPGTLTLVDLRNEISNRRPMFIYLQGIPGHFVAITGYSTNSTGETRYRVQDPANGTSSDVLYEDLRDGKYGNHGGMSWFYFTKP